MNTEPPTGDDLQRMLVDMKQSVLKQAEDVRPGPVRRRHVWPVVGLVVLLAAGTASGAYAAGLVPKNLFGAPVAPPSATATTAPVTPSATPSPTPESSPPVATPTPSPTKSFALDDPGTWTVSFTEVGPVALGAPYDGEVDDLTSAYVRGNSNCPNPDVSFWDRKGSITLVVEKKDGVVSGVSVGLVAPSDPSYLTTSPTTAVGAGVGTTLDELKADYPGIAKIGSASADMGGAFDLWSIASDGHYITFELDDKGARVGAVWVGTQQTPPSEFCG